MGSSVLKNLDSRVRSRWLGLRSWTTRLVCVCLTCCLGCSYPEISPKAYEISKALYSVCNLKRESDLDKVSEAISESVSKSELSESESEWLLAIVEQARSGEWDEAAQEARSILQDQVDL